MPCGKVIRRLSKTFSKRPSGQADSISGQPPQSSRPSRASRSTTPVDKTRNVYQKTQESQTFPQVSKPGAATDGKFSEDKSMPVDDGFDVLPTPMKFPSDKKEYVVIKLTNGLTATLISDSERSGSMENVSLNDDSAADKLAVLSSNQGTISISGSDRKLNSKWLERDMTMTLGPEQFAACAVTVQVGSFSDPDDIPGLCHLLEHVVSMGSDRYPEENEFEMHLSRYGGSYDAETECEYTTFHVECREQYLKKTLEMFSRFFIAPLLKWESVRRERNVVDSEFAEHVHSDNARRMQLITSTAVDGNPANKFTWGNLKTLQENVGSEKLLKALGDLKHKHFSALRMKIAIQASAPIEILQQWIKLYFSDISVEGKVRFSDSVVLRDMPKEPFTLSQFCRLYRVQSMGDICDLNINWALPPMVRKYKTKPLEYLSYVIGAEGRGSLIAHLRKHRLALFLTAEVEDGGICSNSIYTIFTICISLTEEGRQCINDIIARVFCYLKMLRTNDASEDVFNELKDIADTNFRFSQDTRPVDHVTAISQNMTVFPSEDYLTGWALFYEFSSEDIEEYLNKMIPSRANILLHMKNHDMDLDKEERWFKTKYRSDEIPKEWLREWEDVDAHPDFSLPRSNPYLTTNFGLVSQVSGSEMPEQIIANELYEVWHKGCSKDFKVPFASVNILINIPRVSVSAENTVRQMLLSKMFTYQMIDELYFAHVAQIEVHISSVEYGMEIAIYGFSEKMHHILKSLAQGLMAFKETSEQQQYMLEYLKTVHQRNLRNTIFDGGKLLEDIRKSVLTNMTYTSGEKMLEVDKITLHKMEEYRDGLFRGVYVQALVEGNIMSMEAQNMVQEFVEILNMEPGGHKMLVQPLVKEIPCGDTLVSIATFHPDDGNLYTEFYYQYGPAKIEEVVAMQLFVAMMREPMFDELRTKEQLGYSVFINVSEILGVLGIVISVSSQVNKYTPEYVRTRIESFTRSYLWYFKMLPLKEFRESKDAFLALKRMKSTGLRDEAYKDWWEIRNSEYKFDRLQKEMFFLKKLEKKTVYDLAESILNSKHSGKILIMQVVGKKTYQDSYNSRELFRLSTIDEGNVVYQYVDTQVVAATNIVKDLMDWKNSLQNYPQRSDEKGPEHRAGYSMPRKQ